MKFFSILAFSAFFILSTSCGNYHYTGDYSNSTWSADDIESAELELNRVRKDILAIFSKKDTKKYMDCYMNKLIKEYRNFPAANEDEQGCTILATRCVKELGLVAK